MNKASDQITETAAPSGAPNGPAGQGAPRTVKGIVQGIVIASERPVEDLTPLLRQIVEQQQSLGYGISASCVAKASIIKDLNDKTEFYVRVHAGFQDEPFEELIQRTHVYPFTASDGNAGKYGVVFAKMPTGGQYAE
ncbi:MAG: hypothetical protein GX423_11900 [Nitrospiraceae bacterium]|jgi:hypothetical protein|nr:hypothetical protein [Nitrospiraceae bacterium]